MGEIEFSIIFDLMMHMALIKYNKFLKELEDLLVGYEIEPNAKDYLSSFIYYITQDIVKIALDILHNVPRKKLDFKDIILAIKLYEKKRSEGPPNLLNIVIIDKIEKLRVKLKEVGEDVDLVKKYTEPIEDIFFQIRDIKSYLEKNLPQPAWRRIKASYEQYKNKKISRKQFIKLIIKELGKNFIERIFDKFLLG